MVCRTAVRLIVLLAGLALIPGQVLADVVVPSPDVTTRVIVRASASSQSAQIGSLTPGQQLELIGSMPNPSVSGWNERSSRSATRTARRRMLTRRLRRSTVRPRISSGDMCPAVPRIIPAKYWTRGSKTSLPERWPTESLLREPDAAKQVCKARIGAQAVEFRIYLQKCPACSLVPRPFQPKKGIVFVAKPRIVRRHA